MKSIIEQLFSGEVYPAEQVVPRNPEYRVVSRAIGEEKLRLENKLPEEDWKKLEELFEQILTVHDYELKAMFAYGIRFGAQLWTEIYDGKIESPFIHSDCEDS